MKTFLRTTLFWILVVVAGLLCLGFGNLGTQVLDNGRMVKYLPHNVQNAACEPVVASAMENVDWCGKAESYGCYPVAVENENSQEDSLDMQALIDSLSVLSSNQETIYNQINDYYSSIMQNFGTLAEMYYSHPANVDEPIVEPIVDEREQQRLELQAQIEALQYQMENL